MCPLSDHYDLISDPHFINLLCAVSSFRMTEIKNQKTKCDNGGMKKGKGGLRLVLAGNWIIIC